MKKSQKKSKARNSNNANAVLNEVGGAVTKELKWKHIKGNPYRANDGQFTIYHFEENRSWELVVVQNKYTHHDIPFKKLSSAKKVAQLIYNG